MSNGWKPTQVVRMPRPRQRRDDRWLLRVCITNRSVDIVAQALRDVGLEPRDVGQLVLTGGCTRIPVVRAAVSRFFDREVETHVNPDEAVALGAAVQGALVARKR